MTYGRYIKNNLPRLVNYERAARWESEVKPIRGDKNGTKPLGLRKAKYISIRKEQASGDIILSAYGDEYLRFHKRGHKVTLTIPRYGVAGVSELVSYVLGVSVSTFDGRSWVRCATPEFDNGWVPIKKVTTFKNRNTETGSRWGAADLFLAKPKYPVIRTINRKKSNEARKPYTGFIKQAMGVLKLLNEPDEKLTNGYGGTYTQSSLQTAFYELATKYLTPSGTNWRGLPTFRWTEIEAQLSVEKRGGVLAFAQSGDNDERMKAILFLAGKGRDIGYLPTTLMTSFKRQFQRELLKANPHVLDKETVRTGKRVKDRFAYVD